MIQFSDKFGVQRAIDLGLTFDGKYVTITQYCSSRNKYGDAVTIPLSSFTEIMKYYFDYDLTEDELVAELRKPQKDGAT